MCINCHNTKLVKHLKASTQTNDILNVNAVQVVLYNINDRTWILVLYLMS